MNDTELDQRLAQVVDHNNDVGFDQTLARLSQDAAAQVRAESTGRTREPARPTWRRGSVIAAALAGATLLVTAGTSVTAYYLGIPPFQTLEQGALRTTQSIPMDYTTQNGVVIKCRIFLEFKHVPSAQIAEVDDAIKAHDWSSFGQSLYNAQPDLPPAPPSSVSLSPQDPIEAAKIPAVYSFAASVVPGLELFGNSTQAPQLSTVAETCVPSAQ